MNDSNACFAKARELGEMIINSAEAERLRLATEKLTKDGEAMSRINKFDLFREKIAADIEKGISADSHTDELRRMYQGIESEPLLRVRRQAEAEYERMVNSVLDILNITIGRSTSKCTGCGSKHCQE